MAPAVIPVAASAAAAAAPAEGGWSSLFSPDLGLSIWTVLTFLTMLAILARFAWKPLLGALQARESGIQNDIDDAKRQREDAERVLADYQAQLAEGRRQAQAIVAESREAAGRLRKELEAKARQDAQAILEAARRDIKRERDAAVEVVRREAVELALAAAERLISERLDGDRDRKLVMGYIDALSADGAAGFRA